LTETLSIWSKQIKALLPRLTARAMLLFCLAMPSIAEEWPGYRGPHGDGICREPVLTLWPEGGPNVLWRAPLTHGFSSMTIVDGKVVTMIKRSVDSVSYETCVALNIQDGSELWATTLNTAQYSGGAAGPSGGSDGPRSTPVINGENVLILDRLLMLWCLRLEDGEVLWSKDIKALYNGSIPTWEHAASPVIDGDQLFVNCGGEGQSFLSLRPDDGSLNWKSQTEKVTYSTPVCAEILGVKQVIFLVKSGLKSIRADNGAFLWKQDFGNRDMFAASPVVAGDTVYASGAYNMGAVAVRLSNQGGAFSVEKMWQTPSDLQNHWTTSVYHDGHVYGMFGNAAYNVAPLQCIELATGTVKWSQDNYGQGGLIVAGNHLIVLSEKRDLVVVEATPDAYREVSRCSPFLDTRGKCWNAPAVSDGVLYVRSTREMVALDVSVLVAAPLKLRVLSRFEQGLVSFAVETEDSSPIPEERINRIRILTSTDPRLPWEEWTDYGAGFTLEPEGWVFRHDVQNGDKKRFFVAMEGQDLLPGN
jgi:outer membrane protein assembly factor BamB